MESSRGVEIRTMTASSVEFFHCHVQLMGLPRGMAGAANGATAPRACTEAAKRVRRNLFGAPEPGEINRLLQKETCRSINYVNNRFNLAIQCEALEQPTDDAREQPTHQPRPTLSAHELFEQERLQQKECNLKRPLETTPPNAKIQPQQSCGKIMRRCCPDEGLTPPTSSSSSSTSSLSISSSAATERQKSHLRQLKLTDQYNVRKTPTALVSSSTSTSNSPSSSPSPSPTPSDACASDTHSYVQTARADDNDATECAASTSMPEHAQDSDCSSVSSTSSAENSPRQCNSTTLSLKVVVATQDALASATPSASRERTHHA